MSDYFKRINLDLLYPPFKAKVLKLQENCLFTKAEYYGTSGLRTWDEQDALYALGRTKPNTDATPQNPMGNIVTNAKGGQSYHNFGIATDFALDKDKTRDGLQPDWNSSAYTTLGHEASFIVNLEWGGQWLHFKDFPHVQLNISNNGLTLLDLQNAYHKGGIKEVWALLDTKKW